MSDSIYDLPLRRINGEATSLAAYRGKVVLVVNVASACGLTPQYEGLEKLYADKEAEGLVVAGFPANEFGAQFAHHDGGLEDNANLLDSSLAAADLVICQTGCISHSAYWRVKDYCKRTGKRCVFIDNPSISSLARGLQEVSGEMDTAPLAAIQP